MSKLKAIKIALLIVILAEEIKNAKSIKNHKHGIKLSINKNKCLITNY